MAAPTMYGRPMRPRFSASPDMDFGRESGAGLMPVQGQPSPWAGMMGGMGGMGGGGGGMARIPGGQMPSWAGGALGNPWMQGRGVGGLPGLGNRPNTSGSPFEPGWGGHSWEAISGIADPQWLAGLVADYRGKLGYFGDPRTSVMADFSRQQAAQTSGAMQRRAQLAGQVSGLPAGQRGFAWLQSQLGGQGSEAAIINQLLREQFQQQQDYARQVALALSGTPDTRAQTRAMNQAWMGPAAQIGGAALGSIFGPAGMAAGAALGGAAGGGGAPTMGQPGFRYPYMGG